MHDVPPCGAAMAPCTPFSIPTPAPQTVLEEMNRLGMIVDLAHVSVDTMKLVLSLSKAPVIFSHSSAYSLCPHRRNVPDDVLRTVVSAGAGQGLGGWGPRGSGLPLPQASTGSLVMVNFYNAYVTCGDTATLLDVAGEAGARAGNGGGSVSRPPRSPRPLRACRPHGLREEGGRCPVRRLRRGLRRGPRVKRVTGAGWAALVGWGSVSLAVGTCREAHGGSCPHHGTAASCGLPQGPHRSGGRLQVPGAGGRAAGEELDRGRGERSPGRKPAPRLQEGGGGEWGMGTHGARGHTGHGYTWGTGSTRHGDTWDRREQ